MRTYSSDSGESPVCGRFTNWTIASGDLENSVTFESSSDSQETADFSPNSIPLILKPPAPESGPCEIQLSFSQKYEIRQIYVQSTARAYEIYYSQSEQSGNEYLCTVRCSIAERDGKIVEAVETLAEGCTMDSSEEMNQEKFPSEGNSATSEDDWVNVRAFDPPHCELKTSSLSMKGGTSSGGSGIQDFYEATAEINDSDPCTSLTIRLLSLQNKGCVCIGEIYIFADPVTSTEPENQAHLMNSSTGSALMAMLVPTILQLSRSGTGQVQSQQAAHEVKSNQLESQPSAADLMTDNAEGKAKQVENDLISTDMTNDVGKLVNRSEMETKSGADDSIDVTIAKDSPEMIMPKSTDLGIDAVGQQDMNGVAEPDSLNVQDAYESTVDPPENLHPHQILDGDISSAYPLARNSSPDNHVEKILEQLLCRMTKIEEVCTRFEESMLRPMTNMEIRIQQVEQQLNSLAKNSQYSGLPHHGRFSAPSFSCVSNSSSFHDDGCNDQPRGLDEFEKKDITLSNIKPCDHGMLNSQHSGLPQYTRFSMPSFTCDSGYSLFQDDGHNYQPSGSHEFEKKDFTIGGMPNSVQSPHRTPYLVVTAPEFSSEDDQCVDELKSVHDSNEHNSKRDDDIGGLKLPQDCPIQNPMRILIDDVLASSLSGLLSESASHPSKDKQPTDDTSKNFLAEEELLQTRPVEIVADACSIKESTSYSQSLTFSAPEFTSQENVGEEFSDFQSASQLPDLCSELTKDDASSVVSNSVEEPKGMTHSKKFEPLADLLTLSFDSEFVSNDYSAAQTPLEVSADDKEEIKGVLNPPQGTIEGGPYVGTDYLFEFFKDIEAIEPLTSENIFSCSDNLEAAGRVNDASSIGNPCASFNQDAGVSLNMNLL